MKHTWLVLRSTVLWVVTWIHFFFVVMVVLLLAPIVGDQRMDRFFRFGARNIVRCAGARLKVRFAGGFQRGRTCFFVSNHVNLFDPFLLYAAIRQHFRGLELESHFKVPVYGWLMKHFGNVPVPEQRTASGLKRTYRLTKATLDSGTSLMVFPEGGRTLDGRVGAFEAGVFRMARHLGYPITPVSIVNAYRWKHKGSSLLRPATVEVIVHDTIDVEEIKHADLRELRERVRRIIAQPVRDASEP